MMDAMLEGLAESEQDRAVNNHDNQTDGDLNGGNGPEGMELEDFAAGGAPPGDHSVSTGASEDQDWVYPINEKYQHYIVSFFRITYPSQLFLKDQTFTKEQLLSITPGQVRRWLQYRAYRTKRPGANDFPIYSRAGSLEKAKSGLSFYHPNKHAPWIEGRGGNPTLHPTLTATIKKVEQFEARGQGVPSNEKRPYTQEEYNKLLEILR